MEHIKKKMQAMKLDKENAIDMADQQEAKVREKELEMQTKDEEMAEISKRIQQLETDKDTAQTQFEETNQKLDETEKRATEVSYSIFYKSPLKWS
ncbi:Tropomyosin [Paragonimus heterotremus]|uniref:Tropomyosin n=1 Tax=Paragonimus heterotremus TaxID=100268 RepID=A0A8J4WFQ7_9TREM|nr:Tropomyosin [Paragonimus heterotremus]